MILFKGKKYEYIHTQDITFNDIRAVFFPKNFWEKYRYLGSVPFDEEKNLICQSYRSLFEYLEENHKRKT